MQVLLAVGVDPLWQLQTGVLAMAVAVVAAAVGAQGPTKLASTAALMMLCKLVFPS